MAGQGNKKRKPHLSGKTAEPAFISKLTVKSNKNKDTASIVNGTVQLQYWESILQDSIRASVVFTDTGNSLPKKRTLFGRRFELDLACIIKPKLFIKNS